MKVIILGKNGMLGHDLVNVFKSDELYAFDKHELDITDKRLISDKINEIEPDLIINAAAYTNVDECEHSKELAFKVNANGVKNIAESCNGRNCIVMHISTDYVFSGRKNGYEENDKPDPINVYGRSKHLGEKNLRNLAKNYYIIRTSWLFGKNGKNFVDAILNLAKHNKKIDVVNDQRGNPTYTVDLAKSLRRLIELKPQFGIYHLTNEGVCTWFQFAKKIVQLKKLNVEIKPITSDKLKRAAKRPKYSVLINIKLPQLRLRRWEYALKDYLSYDGKN